MQNLKSEVIRFAIWTRNGIAFCTTWFLVLILAHHLIFHIQAIQIHCLVKLVLLIIVGVLIFNLCFTRLIIKKKNFTARLTCFMFSISLYECLGFYWLGLFNGPGTAVQWVAFVGIICILYLICMALYQKYSKRKGRLYTEALQEYQAERSMAHEK